MNAGVQEYKNTRIQEYIQECRDTGIQEYIQGYRNIYGNTGLREYIITGIHLQECAVSRRMGII